MLISDMIENFINQTLRENEGFAEFTRSNLADKFKCVPSQISYVISSRFSPERGYLIESKRGGGGFIKITQVQFDKSAYIMHFINAVGAEIDYNSTKVFLANMYNQNIISEREARMILNITSDNILRDFAGEIGENGSKTKDEIRACILKNAVLALVGE